MKIRTLALRIFTQLRHDRRTMALVLLAPILVLGLLYLVLSANDSTSTIVLGKAPSFIARELKKQDDIKLKIIAPDGGSWNKHEQTTSKAALKKAIDDNSAAAALTMRKKDMKVKLYLDGSDAGTAAKISAVTGKILQEKAAKSQKQLMRQLPVSLQTQPRIDPSLDVVYIYGNESGDIFDNYGAALIGIIVFFFVFLLAGINFLTERISGTLEKMLASPIRRYEIVFGYTLGFSILALVQTALVTLFAIYVIGLKVVGSIWLVFLINLLTAICALTLGILLSSLANSEFQMMQFIPVIVIPQVFLCGMFRLSGGWDIAGHLVPLYYTNNALQDVILRGRGLSDIWMEVLVLLGFSIIFIAANITTLRKERGW